MEWTVPGILEYAGAGLGEAMETVVRGAGGETCGELARALLKTRGKRIRPALALGTSMALEGTAADIMPLAAAVEWIHTASLIHDDIEDIDQFRRGEPSVWRRFGVPQAINAGDWLLAASLGGLAQAPWPPETRLRVLAQVLDGLREMAASQMLELDLLRKPLDRAQYAAICSGKTGALFRVCLTGPALVLRPEDGALAGRLQEAGSRLGELFQMRDDIIDILGKKEGREPAGDLRNGNASFLIAKAADLLPPAAREEFFRMHAQADSREVLVPRMRRILFDEGIVRRALEQWQRLRDEFLRRSQETLPGELFRLLSDLMDRLDIAYSPN